MVGKTDPIKKARKPREDLRERVARSIFRCLRAFFASRLLFPLIYTDGDPGTGYLCVDDIYFNKKNKRLF